jgi:hypothetical protein
MPILADATTKSRFAACPAKTPPEAISLVRAANPYRNRLFAVFAQKIGSNGENPGSSQCSQYSARACRYQAKDYFHPFEEYCFHLRFGS